MFYKVYERFLYPYMLLLICVYICNYYNVDDIRMLPAQLLTKSVKTCTYIIHTDPIVLI